MGSFKQHLSFKQVNSDSSMVEIMMNPNVKSLLLLFFENYQTKEKQYLG